VPARTAATQSTSAGRYVWLAAIAALFSGLVYLNALHNPFAYDDYRTVLNNPSIQDVTDVRTIVYREMTRPMVNLSYAADLALWGETPFGFHVTSVVLHVINVLLMFQLARRLAEDRAEHDAADGRRGGRPSVAAFTTAALFGIHPVMTEAVGYISGRSEVLCGTFFLLALLAARRWIRGDGRRWIFLAFPLWILALLSKEIAAMWPLVLLGYDRLVFADGGVAWRRRWWRVLGPLVALTLIAGLVRVAVLVIVENPGGAVIIWRYASVEIEVAFRYWLLLLSPSGQTIFHEVREATWPPSPMMVGGLVWLVGWVWLAARLRRLDGTITLGMAWFLLLLVPSAFLVLLNLGEPMAEHRAYLAAAGFFLAVGALVGRAWAFLNSRGRRSRLILRVSLAGWLTILGALTVLRNTVWADPVRLWLDAAEKAPDIWVPHLMLGGALEDRGSREEAVSAYKQALRLRPQEKTSYMKLGLCLAEMGRLDEARQVFEALLRLDRTSAVGHNGLGAVAMLAGRNDEARDEYLTALRHHPKDVAARQSLALLYETVWQNPAEALRLCEEVRQLAPTTPGNDACIERNRNALAHGAPR
jgi:tetratricopeptide (TPR) repeat protein